MILQDSLILIAAGLAVGLPLAWFGSKLMATMLYKLPAHDPVSFVAAALGSWAYQWPRRCCRRGEPPAWKPIAGAEGGVRPGEASEEPAKDEPGTSEKWKIQIGSERCSVI